MKNVQKCLGVWNQRSGDGRQREVIGDRENLTPNT
jgi:hypothetical protein